MEMGIKISNPDYVAAKEEERSSEGKTIVITGTLSKSWDEIEEFIRTPRRTRGEIGV